MLPRPTPDKLEKLVEELLTAFEQEPPKFIVDSRKRHIPLERPPYELWPIAPKGFMNAKETHFLQSQAESAAYDTWWSNILREEFGEDEALRYQTLKPFREFVMKNYKIVQMFGTHVLFELK